MKRLRSGVSYGNLKFCNLHDVLSPRDFDCCPFTHFVISCKTLFVIREEKTSTKASKLLS